MLYSPAAATKTAISPIQERIPNSLSIAFRW
jgi:hypothetical protein